MSTNTSGASGAPTTERSARSIRRWRRNLADERLEAAIYRDLATRRSGEEREILLALATAEGRHEAHWLDLLGDDVGRPHRGYFSSRLLGWFARHMGGVFILALAQRAEARAKYDGDADATPAMIADERIHEEVVRGLAERGRNRLSGTFRAAVFGANDGLVSNLALILGIGASGADQHMVLISGLAGLLAGALSMAAGEYVSMKSQRELLLASNPDESTVVALPDLDVHANELALVYRARGMDADEAAVYAVEVLATYSSQTRLTTTEVNPDEFEAHGTPWGAAASSFAFFATGAAIPVLPYIFGASGLAAVAIASALVGVALLMTGASVGLLSGTSPVTRGLRQLGIGYGAAAITYVLGLVFGATIT